MLEGKIVLRANVVQITGICGHGHCRPMVWHHHLTSIMTLESMQVYIDLNIRMTDWRPGGFCMAFFLPGISSAAARMAVPFTTKFSLNCETAAFISPM